MAIGVKQTNPDVKGREINVGVDVHKRFWRVTALLEGVVLMAGIVRDGTRKKQQPRPGVRSRVESEGKYQEQTLREEADGLGNDRGVILITDCECARQQF